MPHGLARCPVPEQRQRRPRAARSAGGNHGARPANGRLKPGRVPPPGHQVRVDVLVRLARPVQVIQQPRGSTCPGLRTRPITASSSRRSSHHLPAPGSSWCTRPQVRGRGRARQSSAGGAIAWLSSVPACRISPARRTSSASVSRCARPAGMSFRSAASMATWPSQAASACPDRPAAPSTAASSAAENFTATRNSRRVGTRDRLDLGMVNPFCHRHPSRHLAYAGPAPGPRQKVPFCHILLQAARVSSDEGLEWFWCGVLTGYE